ncbi:MAG: 5-(carboxyamino)imidazole ribonucleotide mutase [Deltaproteobacteria bacterium]|nr:5-(carboxyamino)imidazole ribonucleotide mutase [Deltaproteobacteria bacterium]
MGSDSDLSVMEETARILSDFRLPCEMKVLSAHRSPEELAEQARKAADRGIEVIIAGAGGAAHLAGVLAAHTILPVIGVPLESTLLGLDSLLSTAQMPAGVPVATMAVGRAGARNAGVLAVQILAGRRPELKRSLLRYKASLAARVAEQNRKIQGEMGRQDNPGGKGKFNNAARRETVRKKGRKGG